MASARGVRLLPRAEAATIGIGRPTECQSETGCSDAAIGKSIEFLTTQTNQLFEVVGELRDKLFPVLTPEGPANGCDGQAIPADSVSPVATKIRDTAEALRSMRAMLSDLIERIEV